MFRALGKTAFAYAYSWGAARWPALMTNEAAMPFIACYHRVVENFDAAAKTTIPSMLTSSAVFEQHIDWVAKRFSIVSLDEIGSQLESPGGPQKPLAAITFDDGYSDVYHHAYPILKRKGIPAAVFVVTDLIGTHRPQIFDKLYWILSILHTPDKPLARTVSEVLRANDLPGVSLDGLNPRADSAYDVMTILLNTLPVQELAKLIEILESAAPMKQETPCEWAPLSWEMLETMRGGGMTIGSHTKSHSLLSTENLETVRTELCDSRKMLESTLNTRIDHFAFPDGRFNPAVVQAVAAAGYRYGYGICNSRDERFPLLTIPRRVLWERACVNVFGRFSPAIMNCHVRGAFDRMTPCPHDHVTIRQAEEYAKVS